MAFQAFRRDWTPLSDVDHPPAGNLFLTAAIGLSNGVASLTDYTLFDTMYSVDSQTTYSDSVAAATESVPEPGTLGLFVSGALMLWSTGVLAKRR